VSRPRDYLGCLDASVRLDGKEVPITLDLFGRWVDSPEGGYIVLDRVCLLSNDISSDLPPEALEILTSYLTKVRT
jgi:hypothetical protein